MAETLRKGGTQRQALREAAKIEAGMRNFLQDGNFKAFTTTFEDLHGLAQLPGLAVQRLMAEGYGFGAEGDWKTSALVRAMKVMGVGLEGGTSFMEDYTYHMSEKGMKVLGAHMLEVCESISDGKPSLEIHPLSIGGKADPARLVFSTRSGPAVNATVIDLGNRFRMIVNQVDVGSRARDSRLISSGSSWETLNDPRKRPKVRVASTFRSFRMLAMDAAVICLLRGSL